MQIYSQYRTGSMPSAANLTSATYVDGEDELAMFGGQTRVMKSKISFRKPSKKEPSTSAASFTPSTQSGPLNPSSPTTGESEGIEVHPVLLDYLYPNAGTSGEYQQGRYDPITARVFSQQTDVDQRPVLPNVFAPSTYTTSSDFYQGPSQTSTSQPSTSEPSSQFGYGTADQWSSMPDYGLAKLQARQTGLSDRSTPSDHDGMDMGLVLPGESGIDSQWNNFMRDSGFIGTDGSSPFAGNNSTAGPAFGF
jgi:hypothetical protein